MSIIIFSLLLCGLLGWGSIFLNWVKLAQNDVYCVVKIRDAMTRPVPVKRDIRQGCPISGQLYRLAIEPLLAWLRRQLRGLSLPGFSNGKLVVVSADDVNAFFKGKEDILATELFDDASLEKVNWSKSEACLLGQWSQIHILVSSQEEFSGEKMG